MWADGDNVKISVFAVGYVAVLEIKTEKAPYLRTPQCPVHQ